MSIMKTLCRGSLLALLSVLVLTPLCVSAQVSLSEIRIDQPSTDNDEYFELTGTAGASLDGLSYVVIGDGAAGSGVIESTVDLGGLNLDGNGFFVAAEGTFSLASAGWAGPDLFVNLNFENSDNVTHLLVSGFTGTSGDDLDSNDDGALDVTPWSAVVDCVALIESVGSGDFTYCGTTVGPDGSFVPAHAFRCAAGADGWQIGAFDPAGGDDTPGAANACGPVDPPPPTDLAELVINEVDYDQPGTDFAEFIELRNNGSEAVDLAPYQVVLVNGNGDSVYKTIDLPAVSLAAGDYFVICGDSDEVLGCDLDVSPDSNLVQNGAPDAVAIVLNGTVVDALSYEGSVAAPYTEGSGAGSDNSSGGTGGPNENKSLSRLPDGNDTDDNSADFSLRCITPGSANTTADADCPKPTRPALVINEIDYDQPGSDTAEFIELKNTGDGDLDLSTVTVELINGNGGAAYSSFVLPAVTLAAGDYFVLCADVATVAECDLDVLSSIQNGAPDAVALVVAGEILDAVSYEGSVGAPYTEGSGDGLFDSGSSGQDFRGIGRFPDGTDTDQNNVDLRNACITPGRSNTSATDGCGPFGPEREIYEIQGTGLTSPFEDQTVSTVDNVVTALAPDGFFVQTPSARSDGSVDTSDGIFVFTGTAPAVAVGDQVTVTGTVVEFFDFTEFTGGSSVVVTGAETIPPAVAFNAAVPSPDPSTPSCSIEYECYEGMLIDIAAGSVSGPNQRFGTDPIAEVHIVARPGRAFREPGIQFPGEIGLPVWDGNPEVFELDPDKLGLPNQVIPAGSTFSATGVLGYEFGGYELWPTALTVTPATLPTAVAARGEGEFTVGSLNLFRLFDDVSDGGETVVSSAGYALRLAKFSSYIREVLDSPDILGVQEVEKLGVLEDLAAQIAADDPAVSYSAYLVEGNDVGGIDVGFLVRDTVAVDAVTQFAASELLTFDNSLLHDRPPLLLEARATCALGGGFPVAVLVVHNRSLSRIDDASDGPRVRQKRLEQAQSIATIVQSYQTTNPTRPLVVVGDFNAYEFTDGYVDVIGQIQGTAVPADNLLSGPDLVEPNLSNRVLSLDPTDRYSFIFRGTAQVLDHALTSAAAEPWVRGFAYGRGNADAAVDLINGDLINGGGALRSSDHDGFVLYLAADCDGDGIAEADDQCPGTSIPENVPTSGLGVNRFALVDGDTTFDTNAPNGVGPQVSFTTEDTAGCSCEQIIDALGLGNGHRKFGCSVGAMQNWVSAASQAASQATSQP